MCHFTFPMNYIRWKNMLTIATITLKNLQKVEEVEEVVKLSRLIVEIGIECTVKEVVY